MSTTFESYLTLVGHSKQTSRGYVATMNRLLLDHPKAAEFAYADVVAYLESLSRQRITPATRRGKLTALKKYFDYLIETGQRSYHPCKSLQVKTPSRKNVIHQDLFTLAELESLLEREERYAHLKTRHQLILSFLIYQAMLPGEIIALKTQHVDLDKQIVYISAGRLLTARKLPLNTYQLELLDTYLNGDRQRLLYRDDTDYLLLNFQGKPDQTIESIGYLMETMKPAFTDRNLTTKTIRDSVISHWLNERKLPLEQVQLMAGHRWISSTQRYQQPVLETQREELNKFFPLIYNA